MSSSPFMLIVKLFLLYSSCSSCIICLITTLKVFNKKHKDVPETVGNVTTAMKRALFLFLHYIQIQFSAD